MMYFKVLILLKFLLIFGASLNEATSKIKRPCPSMDLGCIRSYFKKNGWCTFGKAQDPTKPYEIDRMVCEFPSVNVTAEHTDITIKGLENGKITEFFINEKTGKVILSIQFQDVDFREVATFFLHRPEQEDLAVDIKEITEHYSSILTTTETSGIGKFQNSNSHTSSRIDVNPVYHFYGLEDITDPEALEMLAAVDENVTIVIREMFATRAAFLVEFFIKNVICNANYINC